MKKFLVLDIMVMENLELETQKIIQQFKKLNFLKIKKLLIFKLENIIHQQLIKMVKYFLWVEIIMVKLEMEIMKINQLQLKFLKFKKKIKKK